MGTFPSFLGSSERLASSVASKSCKDYGNRKITTSQECKEASSALNLTYSGTKNVMTSPKGCFIEDYHSFTVFFNTNQGRFKNNNVFPEHYHPICKAGNCITWSTNYLITEFHSSFKCILIFVFLVWYRIVSLNFRIFYLRNCRHHSSCRCCIYCCDCCCYMCLQEKEEQFKIGIAN